MPIPLDLTARLLEQIDQKLSSQGTTLNNIDTKLGAALDDVKGAWKMYLIESLPAGDNIIGRVKLTDGTNVVTVDSTGRLKSVVYGGYTVPKIMDAVTVGTTEVYSSVVDLREYGRGLIIINNTQDVDITVDVEISPDGSNWFALRAGITVASGGYQILDADGLPAPYLRLKCVATTSPTTGAVDAWAVLKQ